MISTSVANDARPWSGREGAWSKDSSSGWMARSTIHVHKTQIFHWGAAMPSAACAALEGNSKTNPLQVADSVRNATFSSMNC